MNVFNKTRFQRGFTLIELLVVIAIIGILASIVLVSLGNARSRGADAGIQGNLGAIRTQAEVYSSNNSNSYGTLATTSACTSAATGVFSDPTIKQALVNASAQAGTATLDNTPSSSVVCGSSASTWAVAVVLKSDATQMWCADSAGRVKQIAVTAADGADEFAGCN